MIRFKLSSLVAIAALTLSLYPLAACADHREQATVTEKVVKVDGKEMKNAKVKLRGSKDTVLKDVDYNELRVDSSGSADLEVSGRANTLILDVSGSSTIHAEDLEADEVEIDMSGSADLYVKANKSFRIDGSGSGKIYLHGKGEVVRHRVTGNVRVYRKK